jgi:nicotinamide mononucleotide (NMN) deamidase PncC
VVERATGVEIVRGLNLEGDRQSIRQQSVDVALSILAEVLATDADS